VEQRAGANGVALLDEGDTALGYGVVEVFDRLEVSIGERLVDE
jgi:hypothetical protein